MITLIFHFLPLFQCKMDGNNIEMDVTIPQMKGKFQGTTKKWNLWLQRFTLLLVPYSSAKSHSIKWSSYSKKTCHVGKHQFCSLEYTDKFIPFIESVWPWNPLYFLVWTFLIHIIIIDIIDIHDYYRYSFRNKETETKRGVITYLDVKSRTLVSWTELIQWLSALQENSAF